MSRTKRVFRSLSLLTLLSVIAACAREQSPEAALTESASREMRPPDEQIAKIYDRSCRNCHTIAATGAPLTGDTPEWSARLEKGMPTMVDNVVSGVGGMPPFGMCMDCNLEEFEALIIFMAQAESDVSDND